MKLAEVGFSAYYTLSLLSFWAGLINSSEFLERMNWLQQVYDSENYVLKRAIDEFLIIDEHKEFPEYSKDDYETSSESGTFLRKSSSKSLPRIPDIYFLTTSKGVLGDCWRFNPYDPDHFPSVPHGHLRSKLSIKLDAYLGHTYNTKNNNKVLKREKRNFIIRLWNDAKFRNMAHAAIGYYMVHHPSYTGWRVKNPLNLPRKR